MNEVNAIIQADPAMAEIIERYQSDPDRQQYSFVEWFLLVEAKLAAAEETVKAQAERILAQIATQRKALHWRYGQDFRAKVEEDLQKHKGKRSVDYLTGRAGLRKVPAKLVVTNAKDLIDWAAVNCPDAVRMEPKLHVTPIKKHVEATGEQPPGCNYFPARDSFFPAIGAPQLEESDDTRTQGRAAGLPEGPDGAD